MTVLSPTADAALVEATLWLVNGLRADGATVEDAARLAAEHLAEQVAQCPTPYGVAS